MIKILVILLLFANISLFAVFTFFSPDENILVNSHSPADQSPQTEGRLRLLSESDEQLTLRQINANTIDNEVADISALEEENLLVDVERCFVIGDFYDLDRLGVVSSSLSSTGFDFSTETEVIEVPGSFVVYLGPYQSENEARRQLLNLQSLNIDSFLINDGPRVNGISLGVFATAENAAEHKSLLDAKGYGYEINTAQFSVEKEMSRILVKQQAPISEISVKNDLETLLEINSDVSIQEKPCNEVAS